MQPKHISSLSLALVVAIHLGVLAAVVMSPSAPKPIELIEPSIQGVLVMAEPEPEPIPPPPDVPPPPPPSPEKKPEPKPKPKPPPKAPPSERAVKAPEPEPIPVTEPVQEKAPAEPTPAPVIPPRAEAGQLNNPAPVYPRISRRLREEGVVVLEILIRADGTVGEVRLKNSSGYPRLDDVATKTVAKWRYEPARQGGIAIDYWYVQPVEFTLN